MVSTRSVVNGPVVNGEHVLDHLDIGEVHEGVNQEPAPVLNQPSQDPAETEQDSEEDADKENVNIFTGSVTNSDDEDDEAIRCLYDISKSSVKNVTPDLDPAKSVAKGLTVRDQNQRLNSLNKNLKNDRDFVDAQKLNLQVNYGKLERTLKRYEMELVEMTNQVLQLKIEKTDEIVKLREEHMQEKAVLQNETNELRDEFNDQLGQLLEKDSLLSREKLLHKNSKATNLQLAEQLEGVLEREQSLITKQTTVSNMYDKVHEENMILQRSSNDLQGKLANRRAECATKLSEIKTLAAEVKSLKAAIRKLEGNEDKLQKQIRSFKDAKEKSKLMLEQLNIKKLHIQRDMEMKKIDGKHTDHQNKIKGIAHIHNVRVHTQAVLKQQAEDFKASKIKKQELETQARMAKFASKVRSPPKEFPKDFAGAASLAVQQQVNDERALLEQEETADAVVASPVAAVQEMANLFSSILARSGNLSGMMPAFPATTPVKKKKRVQKVATSNNQTTLTQLGYNTPSNKRIKKNNLKPAPTYPEESEEEEEEEVADVVASMSTDVATDDEKTTYWNKPDDPIVIDSDVDEEEGVEDDDDHDDFDKELADMAAADDLARAEDDADDDDEVCDDDEPFSNH